LHRLTVALQRFRSTLNPMAPDRSQSDRTAVSVVGLLRRAARDDASLGNTFASVRQRVARHLLDLATSRLEASRTLTALVSQQDLANSVGSVRGVVARVLADLRSEHRRRGPQSWGSGCTRRLPWSPFSSNSSTERSVGMSIEEGPACSRSSRSATWRTSRSFRPTLPAPSSTWLAALTFS